MDPNEIITICIISTIMLTILSSFVAHYRKLHLKSKIGSVEEPAVCQVSIDEKIKEFSEKNEATVDINLLADIQKSLSITKPKSALFDADQMLTMTRTGSDGFSFTPSIGSETLNQSDDSDMETNIFNPNIKHSVKRKKLVKSKSAQETPRVNSLPAIKRTMTIGSRLPKLNRGASVGLPPQRTINREEFLLKRQKSLMKRQTSIKKNLDPSGDFSYRTMSLREKSGVPEDGMLELPKYLKEKLGIGNVPLHVQDMHNRSLFVRTSLRRTHSASTLSSTFAQPIKRKLRNSFTIESADTLINLKLLYDRPE
ncbi:hypothetical protein HDV04_002177 [Boothiomyces sp. JEL0838]|nr:hypothetical protein HDV04_002177 [Boothiomyces sp. JEL0838]